MDPETIHYIAAIEERADITPGCWRVLKITKVPKKESTPERGRIYKVIYIEHESWIGTNAKPIAIKFNKFSNVILAQTFLVEEVFNIVIENKAQLANYNSDRWNCIACGKRLNVVAITCRICPGCES